MKRLLEEGVQVGRRALTRVRRYSRWRSQNASPALTRGRGGLQAVQETMSGADVDLGGGMLPLPVPLSVLGQRMLAIYVQSIPNGTEQ
jgi:hypothetical protein